MTVNPSLPYCMAHRDHVEVPVREYMLREFRRSLWGGTLKEGVSQEVQLRKKDMDENTGKFPADKKPGGKLVEAGVTDALGQT